MFLPTLLPIWHARGHAESLSEQLRHYLVQMRVATRRLSQSDGTKDAVKMLT